jgi:hypothetical protein
MVTPSVMTFSGPMRSIRPVSFIGITAVSNIFWDMVFSGLSGRLPK